MTDSHPILDAFLFTLKMHGLQSSKASFLAGIPLAKTSDAERQQQIDIDACLRAADRKGLTLERQPLRLEELSENNLSTILLLKNVAQPVAVLEACAVEKNQYRIALFSNESAINDENSVQSQTVNSKIFTRNELADLYTGEAIRVVHSSASSMSFEKQSFENSAAAKLSHSRPSDLQSLDKKNKFSNWLKREVFSMRSVYRDVLLASVLLNLFALASPLFVMNVYDRVVPNNAIETLWVLASGIALVFIFDLVIKLLRHYFIELAGQRLDVTLSSRLFEHVLNLRADVFPDSVGEFASKLKDFDAIKQFFTAATLTALVDLPFSLLILLVIFYVGGVVAIAPLVAGLVMVIYGFLIHFPLKSVVEKSQHAAAQKNAVLVESLSGIETLKAFNAEGRQQGFWEECLVYLAKTGMSARRLADSISLVSGFVIQLTVVVVVLIGTYQIGDHQMSMGALIACVLLSTRALAPMVQLASLAAQYYQAKTALGALDQLTQLPVEQSAEFNYLNRTKIEGEIDIQNLSFSYDQKHEILKEINIKVDAGEKVALIGKIGSGKSTLMRLLLGLAKANTGQLRIDHIDIDQIDPAELRACIAYVPQDVTLFRGTLKENILLKSPLSDNDVLLKAAEIAGLSGLVNGHAKGFDLPIGEHGKGLSGGQRQSVAIARAVVGDPQILLFDELTSAMDNQTESTVMERVREFSKDKTMILCTHRASLLSLVDRIIVMDDGRVIADGPKDKVLDALKRGLIKTGSPESFTGQS
ncbi:MAG: ATP-binding cassette subfamily C protein LapB [Oleiphilaceae bacterium]